MRGLLRRSGRRAICVPLALWLVLCASSASLADGLLQSIRDDVRGSSDGGSSSSSDGSDDSSNDEHRRRRHYHGGGAYDDDDGFRAFFVFEGGKLVFYGLTSPLWLPYKALDDDLCTYDYFPRYPYHHVPGYMMSDPCEVWDEDPACAADPMRASKWPSSPRTWSGRFRMEYADEFDDLRRVSGHLLVSTRSRFGLDTETGYFEERLPGGGQDELWLGDCNFVYRFAQGQHAQFRTGLGFNWLDDPVDTNFGVNFTYGADLFPCKPWVLSATIDWGTLEKAELFRFRTTGGVVLWGLEVYTGYEYLDIDSTQINGVIGGVRVWF